jgi:imidazolonepropionase-like amidohydrolase
MRNVLLAVLGTVLAGCASAPASTGGRSVTGLDADLAITNVTVVDVADGAVRPDQTVLVSGNRIAAVGPAGSTRPAGGARVVDARGKYLIPGLWDMHVHAARAERAPRFWPLLIAHGVTGIREMGSFMDSLVHWRTESRRPGALAPRIAWSGPLIEWSGLRHGWSPEAADAVGVHDAAAATTAVDALKRLDFDFIKVGDHGISREAYFALLARALQARIPVIGHVPVSVTAAEASDAGQKSFEHPTNLLMECVPGGRELAAGGGAVTADGKASDAARAAVERAAGALAFSEPDATICGALLDRMAANRTWFTPTLTLYRGETQPSSFDGDPRLRWIPDSVSERWRQGRRLTPELEMKLGKRIMDNTLRTVSLAHRAGVVILAGTDSGDLPYTFAGPSLHDELSMLVDAGLSTLEALQAATLNPARFLGRTDDLGAVQQGKLADLVLLDANPLEDIRNTQTIVSVVLNGRYLDRQALDALLARAEAEARR